MRGEAVVSGPASSPGLSASEFLAFRMRRQSKFVTGASPKNTLPAVFEEMKCKASRMKFQRMCAKALR